MKLQNSLPATVLALASIASLRADFSGDYSIGGPATYSLVNGTTTDVGQWDARLTTTGGSGSVNTNSAPGSVTLSATGMGGFGMGVMGTNASVAFTYTFASSGTVSFDYAVGTPGGTFGVTLDSVGQTATGSAYNFSVSTGQTLSVNLSATGLPGTTMNIGGVPGMPGMPGTPMPMPGPSMTETISLSNFSGPSAVPEPSSFALVGGFGALACAALRRRRA